MPFEIHGDIKRDKTAKIFLEHKFQLDSGTMDQLKRMIDDETTEHIRIMPDCHRGSGCMVGFTSYLTEKVEPKLIGGDIGCGILSYPVDDSLKNISSEDLDMFIREAVPFGTRSQDVRTEAYVTEEDMTNLYGSAWEEAGYFTMAYTEKFGIQLDEFVPDYSEDWLRDKCVEIGIESMLLT